MRSVVTLVVVLIAAIILTSASCYIVDEREQPTKSQMGDPPSFVARLPENRFKDPTYARCR